jgi:hypothetical protein
MVPVSITKISYLNDLDIPVFPDLESEKTEIFREFEDTKKLLNKLEDNETYVLDIAFIPDISL